MTDTFNKLKRTQEKLADKGEHLGTLMWWSLEGNRISHDDLKALASKNNLPSNYLPNEVKPHSAFKRAIRHTTTKLDKDLMLRTINDDKNEIVVGVVHERKDTTAKELRYNTRAKVTFKKANGTIHSDQDHPAVDDVKALYRQHLDHDTDDIRTMMTNFLKKAGVSLRQAGGVYFVPASFQPILDALCGTVEKTGSNQTYQLRVFDTKESKATLAKVTQAGFEAEINQIQEALEKFEFDKARESTLEKKLAGFEELRAKAEMFASVLNFKADKINSKIDRIKAIVRGHIVPDEEPEFVEDEKRPGQGIFSETAGF
jgi:hypothetical protein